MVDLKAMEIPDYNPGKTNQQMQPQNINWPTSFPKSTIGLERKGVITNEDSGEYLPGALEAIRNLRLKGYKIVLIMDESGRTEQAVNTQNHKMMEDFGKAGIMSIDSMYYSIGTDKADPFVKPSTGMFKRCENEFPTIKFKSGWYVGKNINDAKAAFKVGSRGVLINPTEETIKKLDSFANQKIKKKTRIFESLAEFEKTLK